MMSNDQVIRTRMEMIITPKTNLCERVYSRAEIPNCLSSLSD